MTPYGCIYTLKSPSDKFYIGQTTQVFRYYLQKEYFRLKGKRRPKLQNAIDKYGMCNFIANDIVYLYSKEDLDKAEIGFIEMFDSINNGYNIREGGYRGPTPEETKIKIGLANKGKIFTEEHRKKLREARIGMKFSKEHVENIRKSNCKFTYTIFDNLNGITLEVKNLREFCRYNSISIGYLTEGKNTRFSIIKKELCTH